MSYLAEPVLPLPVQPDHVEGAGRRPGGAQGGLHGGPGRAGGYILHEAKKSNVQRMHMTNLISPHRVPRLLLSLNLLLLQPGHTGTDTGI